MVNTARLSRQFEPTSLVQICSLIRSAFQEFFSCAANLVPHRRVEREKREIKKSSALASISTIVEHSGRGYHIYFLAPLPLPCREWIALTDALCREANVDPRVERFPATTKLNLVEGHARHESLCRASVA